MHQKCLNCSAKTQGKFCSNCGQKTNTHRITPAKFFVHDLLHGVWHFDKGIFFTLEQAIKRPGAAALDYIKGKRIAYYNVFYLCLILIGVNILLGEMMTVFYPPKAGGDAAWNKMGTFLEKNAKLVLMSLIPLMATTGYFVFKKMKLNIAEHFIVSGMALLLILFLNTVYNIWFFYTTLGPIWQKLGYFIDVVSGLLSFAIPGYVYWGAIRKYYPRKEAAWLLVLFYAICFFVLLVMTIALIYHFGVLRFKGV